MKHNYFVTADKMILEFLRMKLSFMKLRGFLGCQSEFPARLRKLLWPSSFMYLYSKQSASKPMALQFRCLELNWHPLMIVYKLLTGIVYYKSFGFCVWPSEVVITTLSVLWHLPFSCFTRYHWSIKHMYIIWSMSAYKSYSTCCRNPALFLWWFSLHLHNGMTDMPQLRKLWEIS